MACSSYLEGSTLTTTGKTPKAPTVRERWALLPPPLAEAILGVLDAAFERRPPFDAIERSPFDIALTRLPPPPGLTRDQVRRAVFEELNYLPWSEGLRPPEGGSWLRHGPVATGVDRVLHIPADPYRLTRKVAKAVTDRMRADGALEPGAEVHLSGELSIAQRRWGDLRVMHNVWAVYRALPQLHSSLDIYHLDQVSALTRPHNVFLDPNLGEMHSDEEVERVIRRMWRFGDTLYRAMAAALPPDLPVAAGS